MGVSDASDSATDGGPTSLANCSPTPLTDGGGFADDPESADEPRIDFYGGEWASTVPIGPFILWAIFQSGVLGIGNTNGLVIGVLVGTIVGMFLVCGSWKTYADTIFEGMTQHVAATAIVAWLWAGVFAETLQVGGFVEGLIYAADALNVGAATFPAAAFVLCGLLATGIGTGYGATVAFMTLFFPPAS